MFIRTGVGTIVFLNAVHMGGDDIDIALKIFSALVAAVLIILDCFESTSQSHSFKSISLLKSVAYKMWAWILFFAVMFLSLFITVSVMVLLGFTTR